MILLGGLFSLFTAQIIVGSEIKSQEVVIVETERFLLVLEVLVMTIFVKFLGEILAFLHLILGGEEFWRMSLGSKVFFLPLKFILLI